LKDGHVKGAAAQVVDEDGFVVDAALDAIAQAAAVGSEMIRNTLRPANSPASSVA
jgi:hypothetical protein